MRRDGLPLLLVLAGVTVFFFAGSFLFAQGTTGGTPAGQALPGQVDDKEKITIEFKETSIGDVMDYISRRVGRTIVLEAGIEDKISISFQNLQWLQAVEEAADRARCVTRMSGDRIIVEKPPRVTMEFKRAELVEVINLLAKQAGANIVIDSGVKGEVTMRFSDVPWMRALSAVVKTAGYTLVEEDRGRIIRIVDPAKLQAQMETRVFKFMFIKPDEYYKAIIKTNYHIGSTPSPQDPIKGFTLLDTLRNMLSRPPGATATASAGTGATLKTLGRLDYFKDGNCIVVVDTKPVLDLMEGIIRQLDTEPEQVLTDVAFVTTSNEDFIQMGVNWARGADEGWTISTSPNDQNAGEVGQTTTKYPFNLGPALKGSLSAATHNAFLNDYGMTATLRLFARDSDTEFIQRPNIATRTHMEATIFVGEEIHYAETESNTNQAGALEITLKEADNSPVTVGFQLFLIPHVVVGTNKIIMTVIPQDESLTGTTSTIEGFEHFEATSGATQTAIELPRKRQATIVTHMLLESGQTMVVGGLQQDRTRHTVRKVPYVGDIPVLGWLFKRRDDQVTKDHLFVFVTPRIVRGMQDEAKRLTASDAARRAEVEEGFSWIQGNGEADLRSQLEGRNAANASEFEKLEGGPTPAGK